MSDRYLFSFLRDFFGLPFPGEGVLELVVVDGVDGTDGDAFTAVDTLCIVDNCKSFVHVYRVDGTFLDAFGAADTAERADVFHRFAAFEIAAQDMYVPLILRHHIDNVPRAGYHTRFTGDALLLIDNRQAVIPDIDSVVPARADTIEKTNTAVSASFASTGNHRRCHARLNTVVIEGKH